MELAKRQKVVVDYVTRRSRSSVAELADLTGCSEMTIRRDLESLEGAGVLRRVHGGAESIPLSAIEPPYALRALTHTAAKRALAAACADLLSDGESVVLDSGTTATELAKLLPGRSMTISPLSVQTLVELAVDTTTSLLVPGGSVRPGELAFVGEPAARTLGEVHFDTFVLACCGLDAHTGASTHHLEDARVKRAAVEASGRVIALATREKLGRTAFARVCELDRLDLVVTDAPSGDPQVDQLRRRGVEVAVVPVERED